MIKKFKKELGIKPEVNIYKYIQPKIEDGRMHSVGRKPKKKVRKQKLNIGGEEATETYESIRVQDQTWSNISNTPR